MIAFLAISATSVFMATLFLFLGLLFCGHLNIIQNFQNMFITRGTCDLVLGNICQQLLPWQHFSCSFSLLNCWDLYK